MSPFPLEADTQRARSVNTTRVVPELGEQCFVAQGYRELIAQYYSPSHFFLLQSFKFHFLRTLRTILHARTANEYMNVSHMCCTCKIFPTHPVPQSPRLSACQIKSRQTRSTQTPPVATENPNQDHELLHVKLRPPSSSALDLLRFRIPSLIHLVTSSTVFPRFLLRVFSRPNSVPSDTN
jgi:hypothetical protein